MHFLPRAAVFIACYCSVVLLSACGARTAPPPTWAQADSEVNGQMLMAGSGATRAAAELDARKRMAELRASQVEASSQRWFSEEHRSVRGEQGSNETQEAVERWQSQASSRSQALLREARLVQQANTGSTVWVQLSIPVEQLLPSRRLDMALVQPPGPARREALGALADRWQQGDAEERALAMLAAQLATQDPSAEMSDWLRLARAQHAAGNASAAHSALENAALALGPETKAAERLAYERTWRTLAAGFADAAQLGQGLSRWAAQAEQLRPLPVLVTRLPHGYRLHAQLKRPGRLLALWWDSEDLARVRFVGDDRAAEGQWQISLEWPTAADVPAGQMVLLFAPADADIWAAAEGLPPLHAIAGSQRPAPTPQELAHWRAALAVLSDVEEPVVLVRLQP